MGRQHSRIMPADLFNGATRGVSGGVDRMTPPELGGVRTVTEEEVAQTFNPTDSRNARLDVRRTTAAQRGVEQTRPRIVRLSHQATANAAGIATLKLGGPQQGFVREIMRVSVGPVDFTALTTLVTTFGVTVGFGPPVGSLGGSALGAQGAVFDAQHVIDWALRYPYVNDFSRNEATLEPGDDLFVIVNGLTAGTIITGGGQAIETAQSVGEDYGL